MNDGAAVLIALAIIGLIILLEFKFGKDTKRPTRENQRIPTKEKSVSKYELDFLLDMLHTKLGRKNMGSFRLRDHIKWEAINSQFNQKAMHNLVTIIMRYLGLPPVRYWVFVNTVKDSDDIDKADPAGKYTLSIYNEVEIHVNLRPYYSYDEIMAILCHECTHHYLNYRNIRMGSDRSNERLTDVAAVYLGFGHYLANGYKEKVIRTTSKGHLTTKLGYLNEAEIEYIRMRKREYAA